MWIIEWFHAGAAECYCITRKARDLSKWKFQQAGFSGWNLFSTDCAGSTNCVSVFVPNGRGVFCLYQAGELRSAERGRLPRPRLGQRGRDTCGFPSSLNSYLSLGDSTAKIGEAGPLRKGERQSGYRCVCFAKYSQFTDSVLLHMRVNQRRRGMTMPRNPFARCNGRHLRI